MNARKTRRQFCLLLFLQSMNLQGYNEYFGGFDSWRSGCRRPAAAIQGPKHRRACFSDGDKLELNVQRWNPDVDQSERSYYNNAICSSFTQCIFSIWEKNKIKGNLSHFLKFLARNLMRNFKFIKILRKKTCEVIPKLQQIKNCKV